MTIFNKSQQHSSPTVKLNALKWVIIGVFSMSIIACGGEKKETNVIPESPEIVINSSSNPNPNEQTDNNIDDKLSDENSDEQSKSKPGDNFKTKDTPADVTTEVNANDQTQTSKNSAAKVPDKPATAIASNPDIYTPKALELQTKNVKLFEQTATDPGMLMEDRFYPMGWSADGEKFAYAIVHETDAAATFSVTVFIQDLVTDKLVWKTSKKDDQGDFINYWNSYYNKISAALDKYKIALGKNTTIKQAPISYRKDVFGYNINRKKSKGSAQLVGYQLLLISDKKGSKVISKESFNYKSELPPGTKLEIQIPGHFQSPNEGRIAVLLGLLESGRGGSKIVRYKIIGASLKAGKWN